MSGDPIWQLASTAASTHFEDLPDAVVAFQKKRLLDNIGVCLAGHSAAGCAEIRGLACHASGRGEASIFGTDMKLPASAAAMLNSVAARALDFCDAIAPGYHPSSTDVPTALAVGEVTGASGRDIITALAAGMDVAQRINLGAVAANNFYNGFDSNVLAPLGGAVVAGSLMGHDADQMVNSLGFAFNCGAGTFQAYQDKVLAVRLAQGDATRNGIEAALRAGVGLSAARRILCGEFGFFNVYSQRTPDLELMLQDLGEDFVGEKYLITKIYPSCGLTLSLTDVALSLATDNSVNIEDIVDGELHISPAMKNVCGQEFEPSSESPEVDAMFSVQYVAANALARKSSLIRHFTRDMIFEKSVLSLTRRLSIHVETSYGTDQCSMKLRMKCGKVLQQEARFGRGWPQNPVSMQHVITKFMRCMEYSDLGLRSDAADVIVEMVQELEKMPSTEPLIDALRVVKS